MHNTLTQAGTTEAWEQKMDALMAECPDKLRRQEWLQRWLQRQRQEWLQRQRQEWLQRNAGIASVQTSSPSEISAILTCDKCSTQFTGGSRETNLSRHKNQCLQGKVYPCKVPECSKVYRRNDARLKHYNTKHPERWNI
jgi:hypothetical protein